MPMPSSAVPLVRTVHFWLASFWATMLIGCWFAKSGFSHVAAPIPMTLGSNAAPTAQNASGPLTHGPWGARELASYGLASIGEPASNASLAASAGVAASGVDPASCPSWPPDASTSSTVTDPLVGSWDDCCAAFGRSALRHAIRKAGSSMAARNDVRMFLRRWARLRRAGSMNGEYGRHAIIWSLIERAAGGFVVVQVQRARRARARHPSRG
jgi:hypothetical protein